LLTFPGHLIDRNELTVPAELRKKLLREAKILLDDDDSYKSTSSKVGSSLVGPESCPFTQEDYLREQKKLRSSFEHSVGLDEPQLAKEVQLVRDKLAIRQPVLEVHVRDGSYVVTNHVDEEMHPSAEEDDKPHRAKQKVHTVKNSSPFYSLAQLVLRCFGTKRSVRRVPKNVTVMENVNLIFHPGKIYLIL
jgi:exonuclease I